MKKLCIKIFIASFALLTGFLESSAQSPTASQVLEKAVETVTNSKGVEASFKVFNSGYSGSGSVITSGNRFNVKMPDIEIWFNGKDLFTYNKNAVETTVVNPSQEELAQTNPLAYISGARNNYEVSFSTVRKTGSYVLELTPKTKGGEVKRITLTLNKNGCVPQKLVVEPVKGNTISADIHSFKTGVSHPVTDFEYPKSKFPQIEVIDLR